MIEEHETAYPLVRGFLAAVIVAFIITLAVRRPNPKVTMILTYPAPSMTRGIGN